PMAKGYPHTHSDNLMTATLASQPGRMAHCPLLPGGDAVEDAPPRTVLEAVGTNVCAVVAGIQAESRDDDEHVCNWGGGGVDGDPAPRTGRAPLHVILRERITR